ncbi:MAG: carbohydrate-binding family 9-like protein [Victivallaceae bacterium]|nr:carbohydrate-binding family 9-like protein [Victivallaceae bacterium]
MPNGGFEEGYKGWHISSFSGLKAPSFSIDKGSYEGTKCLKVVMRDDRMFLDVPYTPFPWLSVKENTVYNLTFAYKTRNPISAYLIMQIFGKERKHIANVTATMLLKKTARWQFAECDLSIPEGAIQGYIRLRIDGMDNNCFFLDNVKLVEKNEAAKKETSVTIGGRSFVLKERNAKPVDGIFLQKDSSQDLVFYLRNPRDTYENSVPRKGEIIKKLEIYGTPGQVAAFNFSIFSNNRKQLQISRKDFVSAQNNKIIPRDQLELKLVKFWLQKTSLERVNTCYRIPELLETLQDNEINCDKAQSRGFYGKITIPQDTAGGQYNSKLLFTDRSGRQHSLDISLRVFPFQLETPENRYWLLYSDINYRNWQGGKLKSILKMIRDTGFSGTCEYILGNKETWPEYFPGWGVIPKWDGDLVTEVDVPKMKEFLKFRKELGFYGPFMLSDSFYYLMNLVNKKLNIQVTPLNFSSLKQNDRERFEKAYVSLLKSLKKFIENNGGGKWVYEVQDEPGSRPRYHAYTLWAAALAKQAGLEVYAICGGRFQKKLAPYLDILCSGAATSEYQNQKVKEFLKDKKIASYYVGSGCYDLQEGGIMPNRYLTGFLFWKSGAGGQVTWTLCQSHGDPYNDFDSFSKDPMLIYPPLHGDGEMVTTLQWEGLREGILDYKYLYKLSQLIETGKKTDKEAVFRKLDESLKMIFALLPWYQEYGMELDKNYWLDNNFCEMLRKAIILETANILDKNYSAAGKYLEAIKTRLKATNFAEKSPTVKNLPLLKAEVKKCRTPPKIDGFLTDPSWAKGAATHLQLSSLNGANVNTQVLLNYDANNLYFAFICEEPEMTRVRANIKLNDDDALWKDDCVEIFLSAATEIKDEYVYYHFIINSLGIKGEGKCVWEQDFTPLHDGTWNCSWTTGARREAKRWIIEGSVSLAAIGALGVKTLRANFCRERYAAREKTEYSSWAALKKAGFFHTPECFGYLNFID